MNKFIIWKRIDGTILITNPSVPMILGESEAKYYARIKNDARADAESDGGVFAGLVKLGSMPTTARFKRSWRFNVDKVEEDPIVVTDIKWEEVRTIRDALLLESDVSRKISEDSSDGNQGLWKQYQIDLRDVPNQLDPDNIVWPVKP